MKNFKVCFLFFTLFLLYGCGGREEAKEELPRYVRVGQVERAGEVLSRRYPGIAKGGDEVDLAFRVSGVLEKRPVNDGDLVQRGELLAQLEQQDFIQEIQTVEGELERAIAAQRRAEADLKRYKRIQEQDAGAIDQQTVDAAQQEYEGNVASVKSFQARLQTAKNQLDYTTLFAPFEARVIQVFPENYQRVQEGERVIRLINYETTEVELSVPEVVMPHLDKIEAIAVHLEVYPDKTYPAEIYEIGAEASSTTRTYPVTLRLQGKIEERIYPGMAGTGTFSFRGNPNERMMIPETAQMIDRYGKSFVWVFKEGTVRRRDVTISGLTPKGVLVLEGVSEGEEIVISGGERLDEGQAVEAIRKKGWP